MRPPELLQRDGPEVGNDLMLSELPIALDGRSSELVSAIEPARDELAHGFCGRIDMHAARDGREHLNGLRLRLAARAFEGDVAGLAFAIAGEIEFQTPGARPAPGEIALHLFSPSPRELGQPAFPTRHFKPSPFTISRYSRSGSIPAISGGSGGSSVTSEGASSS